MVDTTTSVRRRDTQRLSLERQSGQKPAPQPPGECGAAPGCTRGGRTIACLGVLARLFRLIWREGLDLWLRLALNSILLPQPPRCRNDIMPEPGTAFKECDGRYFSDKGNRSDAGGQAGRAPWVGSQSLLKAAFTIPSLKGHLSHRGEK